MLLIDEPKQIGISHRSSGQLLRNMALVVKPGEVPLPPSPSPSPVRVGSKGPIRFLMEKEQPSSHRQPFVYRAKSSKEVSVVCREVVSVSCGQPLLSYKPKRTKCIKTSKSLEVSKVSATAAKVSHPISADKSARSISSQVRVMAIRWSGCSEVHLDVPAGIHCPATHAKESPSTSDRVDADHPRKVPAPNEATQQAEYPVFQSTVAPINLLLDEYHKAFIPFLRNELDAPAKILKKRLRNQTVEFGSHRRTTNLGNYASSAGHCEQITWQAYSRDSYPLIGQSKNFGFLRLTN